MSIWADMHRISTGEMKRKEDSIPLTDELKGFRKAGVYPEVWKSLYGGEPIIYTSDNKQIINEIREFSWDKNRMIGDYYVVDHLDLI